MLKRSSTPRDLPTRCLNLGLLVLVSACSGSNSKTIDQPPDAQPLSRERGARSWARDGGLEFPDDVRSLRLRRSIAVRSMPNAAAANVGTVARNTRVAWKQMVVGPGCQGRWIEIVPRGWVCEAHIQPSKQEPFGVELPRLDRDRIVPGTYGKLVARGSKTVRIDESENLSPGKALAGSVTVRKLGERVINGESYWRISAEDYLPVRRLREHVPSQFRGVRLGDDTGRSLPIVFALEKSDPSGPVWSYLAATGGARTRRVPGRSAWQVLDTVRDQVGNPVAYRIGENQWLSAESARFVTWAEPPPLTNPHERWIDIVVDQGSQVLVAYEGTLPVYATLVSSGTSSYATPPGIYRVWIKFAETDMSGQMSGPDSAYSVAEVPWTQFYAKDFAIHTAYWHDKFGVPRSHGCINLSPMDARFLYFWSAPDVPQGWSMAHGTVHYPGSMVRVRSADVPDPEFTGYAKRVYQARVKAAGAD